MLSFYKKYWRTAFDIALIALTVWLTMYAFSFLYRIATPVFLSFLIFIIIEPLAKRLHRAGMKKSIASAISVLVFTLIILSAFAGAGFLLINETSGLIANLPQYQETFTRQAASTIAYLQEKYAALPPGVTDKSNDVINNVTKWGTMLAHSFLTSMIAFLTSFSAFIFNFAIGIVLAYFLSVEIEDWRKNAQEKTPRTFKKAFHFLKNNVFAGIGGYLKSQLILISITFLVVLAALLILGVNNAFMIAVISGVFDVLPLLGVGTVFIPWIVYLFIVGDTTLAIWLTVVFLLVVGTRQILEPKITGDTLGVSAFTMLVFMIISLSLFGVAGVIISPILVILIKALYDQRYFHRWIRAPQGEFDQIPPSSP
jgi:sporulation integral membrane protein YtvI